MSESIQKEQKNNPFPLYSSQSSTFFSTRKREKKHASITPSTKLEQTSIHTPLLHVIDSKLNLSFNPADPEIEYLENAVMDEAYVPKFLTTLKKLFIDIKQGKIKFKKNSRIKIFEHIFNEIAEQSDFCISDEIIKELDRNIFSLIHFNQHEILDYFITHDKDFLNHLKKMLPKRYDKDIKSQDIFIHAISRNAVDVLKILKKSGWQYKVDPDKPDHYFKAAISSQSKDAVAYLLENNKKISYKKRLKLAEWAKRMGNVEIVNLLLPDEPIFYFSTIIQKLNQELTDKLSDPEKSINFDNEIFNLVSRIYRYSNMQVANEVCQNFIDSLQQLFPQQAYQPVIKEIIQQINTARNTFPFWASQITRHNSVLNSKKMQEVYGANTLNIESEIKFGLYNFNLIKKLCDNEYKKPDNNTLDIPNTNKSPENFYSMRDLLYIFSQSRVAEATLRGHKEPHLFGTVRKKENESSTVCGYTIYDGMYDCIEAMYTSPDRTNFSTNDQGYTLFYNRQKITNVELITHFADSISMGDWECNHGLASIKDIWPIIEEKHKIVLEMSTGEIRLNPQKFYDTIAEVIWLMGNLQPMQRGTGRYVEQWLALVHYYHKLPIPVLKSGWQQDCLNITLDLDTRQKLFLNFFEPASLPEFAQSYNKKKYETDPDIQHWVNRLKLDIPKSASFTTYSSATQHLKNTESREITHT